MVSKFKKNVLTAAFILADGKEHGYSNVKNTKKNFKSLIYSQFLWEFIIVIPDEMQTKRST